MNSTDYLKRAEFHRRYLAECRTRAGGPNPCASDALDIAADEAFCEQAALSFDPNPERMAKPLVASLGRLLNLTFTATDFTEAEFARAIRQRIEAFRTKAVEGEHFAP